MKIKAGFLRKVAVLSLLTQVCVILSPVKVLSQNCPIITSYNLVTVANNGNNECTYRVDFTMTVNGSNKSVQIVITCSGNNSLITQCIGVNSTQNGQTLSSNPFTCNCNSSKTLVFNSFTNGSCGGASCTTTGNVLPVSFTKFDAKQVNRHIFLTWEVAQEINNDRFEIERSNNGTNFSYSGFVISKGNSSVPVQYSFTDNSPMKGISFYRLKQVDADGRFTYTEVKRVDNRLQGIQVKHIFPNPSNGSNVKLQLIIEQPTWLKVQLYSNTGGLVAAETKRLSAGEQTWSVKLPYPAAGIYELLISNEKGEILTEKLFIH